MPISLCFFIYKITKYRLAIICNYSNLKCRYNDLEIWVNSINRERLKRHLIKKYKISSLWLDIYNYTINKDLHNNKTYHNTSCENEILLTELINNRIKSEKKIPLIISP